MENFNTPNETNGGNNENNAWTEMAKETQAEHESQPSYKRIEDISAYVKELEEAGVEPITAEKFARIAARKGQPGEKITSWSVDANGNAIVEKEAEVSTDAETGEAGWVATKMDEDGNAIVDANGHTNEWIIDAKTFHKKYEEDPGHPGIFKPAGGPQKFVRTSEAITLNQWGGDMNVDAGGYINITNPNDIYVISQRDYDDTYKEVKESTQAETDNGPEREEA